MVSHGSLSDSKSPQVSWALLGILADLNNIIIWMFSTCPLILNSSSPWSLMTVPSAPTTTSNTTILILHSFFCSVIIIIIIQFNKISTDTDSILLGRRTVDRLFDCACIFGKIIDKKKIK